MSNQQAALKMLRWWYDASGLNFKGITFDQAVDYLTTKSEPRRLYLDLFGANLAAVGEYKAEDAMVTLGEENPGQIPDPQYFSEVLFNQVDPTKITNFVPLVLDSVGAATKEIAGNVSSYGFFTLKTFYWVALGAGIFILVSKARKLA